MSFGTISFVIPGKAVQFARAGSKGAVRFTPAPQRAYMAEVSVKAFEAMGGMPPTEMPVALQMRVEYIQPKSWPRWRRGTIWKCSAPDADNLAKLVKDAMSKIVYADDAQVCDLHVQKVYGLQEKTTITISELG